MKTALKHIFWDLVIISLVLAVTVVIHDTHATGTVVVTPASADWWFVDETPNGSGAFVFGPSTTPLGNGSAQLTVDNTGGELLGTFDYAGTRLDAITSLSYATYRVSGAPALAVHFDIDIDTDVTDATTSWQGRLTYEPYYTHTVSAGVWQTWNPMDNSTPGNWWFSGAPGNAVCSINTPCTWAQILAAFPNAGVRSAGPNTGAVQLKAGGGWTGGFVGNVDAFSIGINNVVTTYDFEAPFTVPTVTSISPISEITNSPDLTLTVSGTNFFPSSIIDWNGASLVTTFASSTQLTGTIPSSDFLIANNFPVTVVNGAPGGGTSSPQNFTVSIPVTAPSDNYATGFENFGPGTINDQDGWTSGNSGSNFDIAVVPNTYGYPSFGTQSLRISNAVTSNGFGIQTFSKSLLDEAGETDAATSTYSGGNIQPYFTAQWDFASADPTNYQPGLSVVASPDPGNGSRMSWVDMLDTPTGLELDFYDYESSVSDFVLTQIATGIDRTIPHTVKVTMQFIDGPSNDIVQVYLDGVLVHTGTSWEDYSRSVGSEPSPVDSIMFRVAGTPAPANLGKGFLIDNFSESSGPVPTANPVPVVSAPVAPPAFINSVGFSSGGGNNKAIFSNAPVVTPNLPNTGAVPNLPDTRSPVSIKLSQNASVIASGVAPSPIEKPALFDITSEPLAPVPESPLPFVIFSVIAEIAGVTFIAFVIWQVRKYIKVKN